MTNIRNALMQAAGSASGDPVYVENVFSNTLYVGNGSGTLNTITTGVDLADKGGAVWIKSRDMGTGNHALYDSERGDASSNHSYKWLVPNENYEENSGSANLYQLHSLTSTGFKVQYTNTLNESGRNFVSWSFAKQEGFFDIQTASLDGSGNAQFTHDLGAAPGMVLVKPQNFSDDWYVYHKSTGTGKYLILNTTAAAATFNAWGNVSATTFDANIGFGSPSGKTVVAYFFADGNDSNAQIFGEDSDEAIIKTGTYTGTGNTSLSVNLGFEPQWLLIKASSGGNAGSQYWAIYDVMRGWGNVTGSTKYLAPNLSSAEATWWDLQPTSTGFASTADSGTRANESGTTYIYMAIRRGPMKEPSAGTDVLHIAENTTNLQNGTELPATGFPVDIQFGSWRDSNYSNYLITRLLGGKNLYTHDTGAASASSLFDFGHKQDVIEVTGNFDGTSSPRAYYSFRRYPKVFDVVVYEGNASPSAHIRNSVTHNLGVAPEMIIHKRLDSTSEWQVGATPVSKGGYLNLTNSFSASFTPANEFTATTFDVDGWINEANVNVSGADYICFLFASLDGISKVGTYTGTGNDVNVTDLGAAARFVLIKRVDSTGDWYVFDTTSGIVSGNDPYILWNSTAAEVTNTDYIDPHSSGFTITSSAPAALNASSGTYIYLAFA